MSTHSDYAKVLAIHVVAADMGATAFASKFGLLLYDFLIRPLAHAEDRSNGQPINHRHTLQHMGCSSGIQVYVGAQPDHFNLSASYSNRVVAVTSPSSNSDIASHLPIELKPTNVTRIEVCKDEDISFAITTVLTDIIADLSDSGVAPVLRVSAASHSRISHKIIDALNTCLAQTAPTLFSGVDTVDDLSACTPNNSLLLAIRDESFSQSQACLRDIVTAKRQKLPILEVNALTEGETRSASVLGNVPSIVWQRNPQSLLNKAAQEWIRSNVFMQQSVRMLERATLPMCTVIPRPPELLDITGVNCDHAAPSVIFHPDPELTVVERRVLLETNRKLQFLTPTTAYRFLTRHSGKAPHSSDFSRARLSPLDGTVVGMSLSQPEDSEFAAGITNYHYEDAIACIARSLISTGGTIAYGGDLRQNGFTELLCEIIAAYARRAPTSPQALQSWLDAHLAKGDDPRIKHQSLAEPKSITPPPLLTANDAQLEPAFAHSDTRRVMTASLSASVLICGKTRPLADNKAGYSGLYPGLLEEAWRMLTLKKPIYVLGGFGGASRLIADMLLTETIPPQFTESHWQADCEIKCRFDTLRESGWRDALDLPSSMDEMAHEVNSLACGYLAKDQTAKNWNGLSREDNRQLMTTSDPILAAGLVLNGLARVQQKQASGKINMELVYGDLLCASPLDVISVPGVRGWPLTGIANRVDEQLGGRLATALQNGEPMLGVQDRNLPTDWLHVATLKPSKSTDSIPFSVGSCVNNLVQQVKRFGCERVGLVLYGGTIMSEVDQLVDEMIQPLAELAGLATVFWYEADRERFHAIKARLSDNWSKSVDLRSSSGEPLLSEETWSGASLLLDYDETGKHLRLVFIPSGGAPIVWHRNIRLDHSTIRKLSEGVPYYDHKTGQLIDERLRYYPDNKIEERGKQIAQLLFGDQKNEVLSALQGKSVQVAVDRRASSIPLELMQLEGQAPLVTSAHFCRRLTVQQETLEGLFLPPLQHSRLRAAVIVSDSNPKSPLPTATAEALAVCEVLERFAEVKLIQTPNVTRDAVIEALETSHILHFCGHSYFVSDNPNHCGLNLDYGAHLTAAHLKHVKQFPRVAFMSSCEVGRLVDHDGKVIERNDSSQPATFAEFFLRAGAQVYIGAHWTLGDTSANEFCASFYETLRRGETASDAMLAARNHLYQKGRMQWGNFLLYGQGNLRLCRPD